MNEQTKTPETLDAILAEMRDGIHTGRADIIDCVNDVLARYADRIEAAVKREKCRDTIYAGRDGEMTLDECIVRCDNNSGDDPRGRDIAQIGAWLRELRDLRRATGNAAAMREAIVNVASFAANAIDYDGPERDVDAYRWLGRIAQTASAALAAPARNCDRFADSDAVRDAVKAAFANTMLLDDIQLRAVCDWLFAPAEGGDHA